MSGRIGRIGRAGIAGAALALLAAAPAAAAWMEARTDHFVVYSDDREAAVRQFAIQLERFDEGLRRLYHIPAEESDPANPVTVYVVATPDAVHRLCLGIGDARQMCRNTYGFYETNPSGSTAFTPRESGKGPLDLTAQEVLFHEYTHHFLASSYSAAYPAWFNEGFAEFNATAAFEKDGTIDFGKPPLYRYVGLLSGNLLTLAEMFAANDIKLDEEKREALYGRGWLLTHYLTFEKSRAGQLDAYLKAINTGKPSAEAARAIFGDLKQLDRELNAYLNRLRITYIRLVPAKMPLDEVRLRALTPGEVATMPVRLRSRRGVNNAGAAAVAELARKLAAPFPGDRGAQLALAEAEFDAGNDDLADTAADRALAAAPDDRDALIRKGEVAVRRARRAKITDPAVWRAARVWFTKANRLQPDDARPLVLFYASFVEQGVRPGANAIAGLERSFELVPQVGEIRFALAREKVLAGDAKAARALLLPVALDPHAPPDNPAAQLVALIDRGDTAGVAAKLASPDEGGSQ